MAALGAICGFFLGFLLYSLVFAQFIKATTVFLWITLVVTTIIGAWFVYRNQEDMEVHISHIIGSYLTIRGIAFFAGGYPNEAETFYKLKKGDFDLPASFYLYFALFLALNAAGWYVQHKFGFDKETPSGIKKGLKAANEGDYTNAKNLVDNEHGHRHANGIN
jgi:hypothetical protein